MNALAFSPASITAFVISLSFAAGLNVYLTILSLGVAARFHWVTLPSGLESLANTWIIIVAAILYAGEFFADKIPGFDVIWNALHTFIRIPAAALLAYAASSHLPPATQLLITAAGAAFASFAHTSKTALRVAVAPSPEPVSNIALSTAEDGLVMGILWVATHHPWIAASAVGALSVGACITIYLCWKLLRAASRRLRVWLSRAPQPPQITRA